jgi:hypothetical protein
MLRGLGLFGRSRPDGSPNVDLDVAGTLADMEISEYVEMPVERRNGLLVRFLASFSGAAEHDLASELNVLLGLRVGRSRCAKAIHDHWRPFDPGLSKALGVALEGELHVAGLLALNDAPVGAARVIANIHGGVTPAKAAYFALRSRKLMALGGRTIGQGISAAAKNQGPGLSPISIIGPIRLQGKKLAGEVRRLAPDREQWWLPVREEEQELRDRVAVQMANAGLTPRLIGSFDIGGEARWALGVEHAKGDDETFVLFDLTNILRKEKPDLSEYEGVALISCDGWTTKSITTIPSMSAMEFVGGRDESLVRGAREDERRYSLPTLVGQWTHPAPTHPLTVATRPVVPDSPPVQAAQLTPTSTNDDDPDLVEDPEGAEEEVERIFEMLGRYLPDVYDCWVMASAMSADGSVAVELVERADWTFGLGSSPGTPEGDNRVWIVDVARRYEGGWRMSEEGGVFLDFDEARDFASSMVGTESTEDAATKP